MVDHASFYQLKAMMQGVLARGTARSLSHMAPYVAGKTGTTDGENDVWFVGFSNDVTVAVWVGYDNADGHRRTLGAGRTGGSVAIPIFEPVMQAAWSYHAPKTALRPASPEAKRDLVVPEANGKIQKSVRRLYCLNTCAVMRKAERSMLNIASSRGRIRKPSLPQSASLESRTKKAALFRMVAKTLGLGGVKRLAGRAGTTDPTVELIDLVDAGFGSLCPTAQMIISTPCTRGLGVSKYRELSQANRLRPWN